MQVGGTCFCVSMNTGPKASADYDLALTEIIERQRHYLVIEAGMDKGAEVLRVLPRTMASADEQRKAEEAVANAAGQMGRMMDTSGIEELFYQSYEHPRWDEVAKPSKGTALNLISWC